LGIILRTDLVAAAMLRHAATCCFAICWLLVIAGTVMYHVVLVKVLPPLRELPDNLAQGFDKVFRFEYMEQDARVVKESAASALRRCNVVARVACASYRAVPVPGSSETGPERQAIVNAFNHSLATIKRVADDEYLGTPELQQTAQELHNITASLSQLKDSMPCTGSNVLYCNIYEAGEAILANLSQVQAEIDRFKSSDEVETFEDYSKYFYWLHALPYVLVIAMFFFSCFWCQGGLCCCQEDAPRWVSLSLIPFSILWLVALILMIIVVFGGVVAKIGASELRIMQLKGEPTVAQVMDHIKATFPQFWEIVFEDLMSGLSAWIGGSAALLAICIIVMLYACCLCCCQPYRKIGLVDS